MVSIVTSELIFMISPLPDNIDTLAKKQRKFALCYLGVIYSPQRKVGRRFHHNDLIHIHVYKRIHRNKYRQAYRHKCEREILTSLISAFALVHGHSEGILLSKNQFSLTRRQKRRDCFCFAARQLLTDRRLPAISPRKPG